MMKIVFLMSSLVGAFGADCAEGYKHKAALVAADICNTKETLKDNCDKCCEKDVTKCGGQAVTTCDAGFYWGAAGDKVTTTATSKVDCCVAQATCAQVQDKCNKLPGYKYKTSAKDTKCPTHLASSCTESCCEKDVLKCGGLTVSCVSPKVPNNGDNHRRRRRKTEDAWKNKATTEANKLTDCCQAKATCATAGYTCQPGFVKDSAKTANECSGQTSSYADLTSQTDSCASTCCKADVTKCAAYSGTAGCDAATHYHGEAATKAATAGTKKVDCCTLKAKCAAATCAAGYKMKASVATTNCATDAASCAGTSNGGVLTCCEKDVTKCGGLTVVCPAASSYNECPRGGINMNFATQAAHDAFMAARTICLNKATTEANKNKLTSAGGCCTAKGTCAAFKLAVATPAVVPASKTAAQLLPGAFLIVVLSALGAF